MVLTWCIQVEATHAQNWRLLQKNFLDRSGDTKCFETCGHIRRHHFHKISGMCRVKEPQGLTHFKVY
jgi:hypothetical protein